MHRVILLVAAFLILNPAVKLHSTPATWWEGEEALETDFVSSEWLQDKLKFTRLSEMEWLNCLVKADAGDKKDSYFAKYEVEAPETAEYSFWVREYHRFSASPWEFRFNEGEWHQVNREHKYVDIVNLGPDRSVVWCNYGKIKLDKGKHSFSLRIKPKLNGDFLAAFDSFFLTAGDFKPNSWNKPEHLSEYEYINEFIWLEGENAESNFRDPDSIFKTENEDLSGGKWLTCSAFSAQAPASGFTASWKFMVHENENYHLWSRKASSNSTPLMFRLNGGKWHKVDSRTSRIDEREIYPGQKICWSNYGEVFLLEGENELEISLFSTNSKDMYSGAIDAICFSRDKIYPLGPNKPDFIMKKAPKGWSTFRAPVDTLSSNAKLDFRSFNHSNAGIHGHLKVSRNKFEFEDGHRSRFWGINAYDLMNTDREDAAYFLKHMAKLGVNLVRLEGPLADKDGSFGKVAPDVLDRLHYFVSLCREEGIYVALAPYSPEFYSIGSDDLYKGYKSGDSPYGLLLVNDNFLDKYKEWASFLTARNPYTNQSLASDPTIAWFEIQNGESLFSPDSAKIPLEQKANINLKYNKWLASRYGSEINILRSWSIQSQYYPVIPEDDSAANREFHLFGPYSLNRNALKREAQHHKRKMDQVRFVSKHQRSVFEDIIKHLRNKNELKCLITAGSAVTSDPLLLDAVEMWTRQDGDFYTRRNVFEAEVTKKINEDEKLETRYISRRALKSPFSSPFASVSATDKPCVLTRTGWKFPNNLRAEAVGFVTTYASLRGGEICIWDKAENPNWVSYLGADNIQTPLMAGQFQSFALVFRRGDIKASKAVMIQNMQIEDQYKFSGTGFDIGEQLPFRPASKRRLSPMMGTLSFEKHDPAAFFVGRVERRFNDSSSMAQRILDITDYHNPASKVIRSATGEIQLDYRFGRLLVNTPKSQLFVGFTPSNEEDLVTLDDVELRLEQKYGSILVTSLDGRSLSESGHILIQTVADERNTGFKTEPVRRSEFLKIADPGAAPLIARSFSGSILFKNRSPKGWKAHVIDSNSYTVKELEIGEDEGAMKLALPGTCFRIEIIKKP